MSNDDGLAVVGLSPIFEDHGVDLLVLVERSYQLEGRALLPVPVPEPFRDCEWSKAVFRDPLLVPAKTATDFVLAGHVRGGACRAVRLDVEVGAARVVVDVMGDRMARATERGWSFTDPEPFDELLIHPSFAYGGIDTEVEYFRRPGPDGDLDAFAQEMTDAPVGAYPRNPKGRGYVVGARIGREVALPNFELASERLTPGRLGCRSQAEWWRMPRPAALGWQPFGAFPRCAFAVLDEDWAAFDDRLLLETQLGQIPPGWLRARAGRSEPLVPRFWNGAHPDLCRTWLSGGEPIRIGGARPGASIELAVPGPGLRSSTSASRAATRECEETSGPSSSISMRGDWTACGRLASGSLPATAAGARLSSGAASTRRSSWPWAGSGSTPCGSPVLRSDPSSRGRRTRAWSRSREGGRSENARAPTSTSRGLDVRRRTTHQVSGTCAVKQGRVCSSPGRSTLRLAMYVVAFLVLKAAMWAAVIAYSCRASDTSTAPPSPPAPPGWNVGSTVDVEFTVVAGDRTDLACVARATAEELHCRFETPEKEGVDDDPGRVLSPFTTTSRHPFLGAGLWSQPAVAQPPPGRFAVQCKLRVVGRLDGVRIRWHQRDPFGREESLLAGSLFDCRLKPGSSP